jgi:hypothetical protein
VPSVSNQTHSALEVHTFDDCSGDETPGIVNELSRHDPRIKYFCQPVNVGSMPNTAAALNSVVSEFFTILNDDDFLAPNFFGTALEGFRRNPKAGVFVGGLIHWNSEAQIETTLFRSLQPGYYSAPAGCIRSLMEKATQTWTSMMFRAEVLGRTKDVDSQAGYAGDLHLALRAMALYDTLVSEIPRGIYCMHPGSSSYAGWIPFCVASLLYIQAAFERDPDFSGFRSALLGAYRRSCRTMMRRAALKSLVREELDGARAAAHFLLRCSMLKIFAYAALAAARADASGNTLRFVLKTVRRLKQAAQPPIWAEPELLVRSLLTQIS